MRVWTVLWSAFLLVGGIVFAVMGYRALPTARGALAVAEATAPVLVTDELVREMRRRGSVSYRKQNIAVAGGGSGHLVVSPPKGLWVSDLDRLDRGTKVRFLIDPRRRLIYEATLGSRTLLAYAEAAGARRQAGLAGLGIGSVLAAIGGFGLWRARAGGREAEQETGRG